MKKSHAEGKPINVSLRVIADLSQGLYRSPADALKELVSNAYDADSANVRIDFSSDFDSITVRDIGEGMTLDKFVQVMETIGGSSKRSVDVGVNERENTKSGRPIVGRIGIGLLSVSQLANRLEVQSTTKGSSRGFVAIIEFDQFASEAARKVKITDLHDKSETIKLGRYYITEITNIDPKEHFTTLKLSGTKRVIRDKLLVEKEPGGQKRMMGTVFRSAPELVSWMREHSVTKTALHEYDRLYWELCLLCPVPYLPKSVTIESSSKNSTTVEIEKFFKHVNEETHFRLFYDGVECHKPIQFPHEKDTEYGLFFNLLFMHKLDQSVVRYRDYSESGESEERKLNVRGYFYFQRPKVWPPELQGLLIRVRNVAVGHYDSTFLTYRKHEGFKFSQLTGEIYVDKLDSALNIDRSSFRETEPAFVALRDTLHNYLGSVVFPGIKDFANQERKARVSSTASSAEAKLIQALNEIAGSPYQFRLGKDQPQLMRREGKLRFLASSIKGKRIPLSMEARKLICYFEATMSKKLDSDQLDDLYSHLLTWLKKSK